MQQQAQAGNGTFTLEGQEGHHLTFSIKTRKNNPWKGQRVVSLMTGSQNDDPNHFTAVGLIDSDGEFNIWGERIQTGIRQGCLRVNKKNPANGSRLTMKQIEGCVNLLLKYGNHGEINGEECCVDFSEKGRNYKLFVSTRCMVCNRKLTTPESVERGIGPECIKNL